MIRKLVLSAVFVLISCLSAIHGTSLTELAALREAADSLHSIGRTDSAAIVGQRAIEMAVNLGDPAQIVGTNSAQGVYLRSLGLLNEALERYETGLEIVTSGQFRQNPDNEAIEEIASLYINLSVLELDLQLKSDASANAENASDWVSKSDDPELRSAIYGVAGSVLMGCGELGKALNYQQLAYKDALLSGDKENAFRAAAYSMLLAERLGNHNEAEKWRSKCTGLMPDINSVMAMLVYYQAECSIALDAHQPTRALKWFDKILNLDGIDNLPFVKLDCFNNMHIAYAETGDYEEAYSSLLKSIGLRDSLWRDDSSAKLNELAVKYETKEKELLLAQSEASRANILMWLFIVIGILALGATAFILYIGRQRRRQMEKELEFRELKADIGRQLTRQYIEGLESERRRMASELHDGVCNDLLAIKMKLSSPEGSKTDVGPLIDECRESVRRISHELMPPEFTYADIDEVIKFYISKQSEACRGSINVYYDSSTDGRQWTDIPDSVSLEIYRITQEAVGNAIKHSGATHIAVTLTFKSSAITLTVEDNGTFIKRDRNGLGLESIRRRAKSVNGTTEINTRDGQGTVLSVKITL